MVRGTVQYNIWREEALEQNQKFVGRKNMYQYFFSVINFPYVWQHKWGPKTGLLLVQYIIYYQISGVNYTTPFCNTIYTYIRILSWSFSRDLPLFSNGPILLYSSSVLRLDQVNQQYQSYLDIIYIIINQSIDQPFVTMFTSVSIEVSTVLIPILVHVVQYYATGCQDKQLCRTSILSGNAYISKLLIQNHPCRI